MVSIIDELKAHARHLHRRAQRREPAALARLRLTDAPADEVEQLQRRHCLAALARELGFAGWPHLVAVLEGREARDFGTLLYPPGGSAHTNIWCAAYDDAREAHARHGGYLLAYKHQFVVVDRYFIDTLGLDPDDPDWQAIGYDWVRPADPAARQRLYRALIADRIQ